MPMPWRRLSRSPSNTAASNTVNGADACSTSEANPVGRPLAMARNRNANWAVPNPSPYPISQRHRTEGRRTNNTVGTATTSIRAEASSSGGKWPSP
jgi:hypothetical protein